MNVWYINSILGAICLEEENDALCGVHFCPDGAPELEPLPRRVVETPLLQEAEEQLNEYFAGVRREFDLPLAAKGTPFQQAVWAQLRKIPYGEVRTYGQLAAARAFLQKAASRISAVWTGCTTRNTTTRPKPSSAIPSGRKTRRSSTVFTAIS